MSADRFVVVGVTRARARWVADLARWSTDGAAPIEFISCLTPTEAGAVLGTGRRVSALLLDARGPGIDRDLIDAASNAGIPSLVVTDGSIHRDWDALGCAAVVDDQLDPRTLVDLLHRHSRPVSPARRPGRSMITEAPPNSGLVLAVTGAGGTGASTTAMALAEAAASDDLHTGGSVALVDGCARGSLAMYHHVGDVVPGLPELVEAHRSDRLDPDEVRSLLYEIPTRGYSVLLGRRRISDWVTLRRRAVEAALDALCRSYSTVVVDFDAELDNQANTGSADVEDRHSMNLATIERAHLILVVGRGDLHGLHGLTAVMEDLLDAGAPAHRLLPVVSNAPRSAARRTMLSRQVAKLFDDDLHTDVQPALLLRPVRTLDDVHDRVDSMPPSLVDAMRHHILEIAGSLPVRPDRNRPGGEQIHPGELGTDVDDRIQLFNRTASEVA